MSEREIVIYEYHPDHELLDIEELSRYVGLHPLMIRKLFSLGLIDPQVEEPELLFECSVVGRIGRIMRLKNDLGVNLAGCGLVLDLLDRINSLEQRLLYYERMFDI